MWHTYIHTQKRTLWLIESHDLVDRETENSNAMKRKNLNLLIYIINNKMKDKYCFFSFNRGKFNAIASVCIFGHVFFKLFFFGYWTIIWELFEKKNFPFEKSKTLRKIFKKGQEETVIHTGDHPQALLATHACYWLHTCVVGCTCAVSVTLPHYILT